MSRPSTANSSTQQQWPIYPDGGGHFALGSPDGRILYQGEAIEILLGGQWIAGRIQWSHNGDYFAALADGTVCGLCARSQVRPLKGANLAADRDGQLRDLQEDILLTFKEAMGYLRVSRSTLYRLMWSGQLAGHKVGYTWRISHKDLRACVGQGAIQTKKEETYA